MMKVKLEPDYRRFYSLEDIDHAKAVMAYEKEDESTAADWAGYAVREALKDTGDYDREVLQVTARTAKNCRAWDAYGEGTGDMDIWIEALARTANGFIEIGAYLSDIWQTGGTDYRPHMYIQRYGRI